MCMNQLCLANPSERERRVKMKTKLILAKHTREASKNVFITAASITS